MKIETHEKFADKIVSTFNNKYKSKIYWQWNNYTIRKEIQFTNRTSDIVIEAYEIANTTNSTINKHGSYSKKEVWFKSERPSYHTRLRIQINKIKKQLEGNNDS